MRIDVVERAPYGTARLYPTNEAGQALAKLLATKTFSVEQLKHAQALGHTIYVVWADKYSEALDKIRRRTI